MDPQLFDKRVVERNIENGNITRAEYENFCAKLPDLEDECEEVEVSLYPSEDDEEETEEGEGEAAEKEEPEGLEES